MSQSKKKSDTAERSETVWSTIGPDGRVMIPAAFREALGLQEGDNIQLRLEGEEVRILDRDTAIREAQELVSKYVPDGVSLVDELIEERRREAKKEND